MMIHYLLPCALSAIAGGAAMLLITHKPKINPRLISKYDCMSKKSYPRWHTDFSLKDDELTLYHSKKLNEVSQNYFLLDELNGVRFSVRGEYMVDIKMTRINPLLQKEKEGKR